MTLISKATNAGLLMLGVVAVLADQAHAQSNLPAGRAEGLALSQGALTIVQSVPAQIPPKRDSLWNGVLIGAGVGGLLGLIPDHYDDCEECHDSLYGSIAVGAGVGLLVDLLRNPKASAAPADRVRLHVAAGRRTVGLRARLVWP